MLNRNNEIGSVLVVIIAAVCVSTLVTGAGLYLYKYQPASRPSTKSSTADEAKTTTDTKTNTPTETISNSPPKPTKSDTDSTESHTVTWADWTNETSFTNADAMKLRISPTPTWAVLNEDSVAEPVSSYEKIYKVLRSVSSTSNGVKLNLKIYDASKPWRPFLIQNFGSPQYLPSKDAWIKYAPKSADDISSIEYFDLKDTDRINTHTLGDATFYSSYFGDAGLSSAMYLSKKDSFLIAIGLQQCMSQEQATAIGSSSDVCTSADEYKSAVEKVGSGMWPEVSELFSKIRH